MQEERWTDVVGYEGLYSVSTNGKVYSHYSNRCLKRIITKTGHCRVHLVKDGKIKCIGIHRLVAFAFIPNPHNKPTVNHINEDKKDNRVENLEWATHYEQNVHGTRIQRAVQHTDYKSRHIDYAAVAAKHNDKELNRSQMKPIIQMSKDGIAIARYDGLSEAARSNNLNPAGICECAKGRRKTCGGYRWKYE